MSTFTYPIFYLLADIFEIFIIYRYMDLFFGWKQHTKVTYFAFVYYFLSTGILHLIIDAPIFNLIFSISAISFVTCTYRTRLWKKICVVLLYGCSRIDSRQYNWLCKNGYDWRRQLSKCRRLNNHEIIILLRYFNIL